jgi:hypothetical protein
LTIKFTQSTGLAAGASSCWLLASSLNLVGSG